MCEIANQFDLNVGIARDTAEDLGTFKGQFRITVSMIEIPSEENIEEQCDQTWLVTVPNKENLGAHR